MNSVCEDCLISYCSCSRTPWKNGSKLQNPCIEARTLCTVTSLANTILPQDSIINVNSGSLTSSVQDSDQAVRGNCCCLHPRCSFCNQSMTPGSSWKRSVKRKFSQLYKEEAEQVFTNVMLLTQGDDLRECHGGQTAGKYQTWKHLVENRESAAVSNRVNLEWKVDGNSEGKCHWEKSDEKHVGTGVSEKQDDVRKLREALQAEHEAIRALYTELEEERKAAAVAAEETMAMISRLQKEKAAVEMEARQYQRMVEEKAFYDQEAISQLTSIVLRKEEEKLSLAKEVEFYQETLSSDRARNWRRESGNIYVQYSSGREMEMLLLEGKDLDALKSDSSRKQISSPFQRPHSSLQHTMPSVTLEPPCSDSQPLLSNSSYNGLLKNLEAFSTEREETFQKAQRSSVNFTYRSSGNKLIDSFNSAACKSKELADVVVLQRVQEKGSTTEGGGLDGTMKRTFSGSPITEGCLSHCEFPFEDESKQREVLQTSAPQWRTNAEDSTIPIQELLSEYASKSENQKRNQTWTEESTMSTLLTEGDIEGATSEVSEKSVCKGGHKPSKTFSRSLKQENVKEVCNSFQGSVSKHRETKGYKLESLGTGDEERSPPLDWENGCLATVHDVYEVQDDHHQNSCANHLRRQGDMLEQNEWKYLERYGSTLQNNTPSLCAPRSLRNPPRQYPKLSPPDVELFNSGKMENLAALGCFEADSHENGLVDLRMRERLGKPEPMLGSIESNYQGARQRQGLTGKRKQTISVSERGTLRLDDVDYNSLHPSSDSSYAVSDYDAGGPSLLARDTSGIGVEDKVKQLTVRLQALEADRESLNQTILSLKKGNDEMQLLQGISHQMQQLRRAERDVKDVHETTSSSIFKVLSQVVKLFIAAQVRFCFGLGY
ncbi:hypothetical protein O6H91_Y562000 [Diphasiastrum complanatum]|nr:hypothetical protein O6H91_Y562000 [Diphasiastrum complanatum]KAJ7124687.1 hypothetical protein O6H91_Y562000 [Diphasiastrum complanatum]KAJ7124690.1 hypothetical protein O6H91_Y562000 [Diphasiastrum complanatum]